MFPSTSKIIWRKTVNVNFDILSKKDAYLERIDHSKNVKFVYKGLVNAIISLPTELFLNLNINLCGTVDLNNIYQRKTIPF